MMYSNLRATDLLGCLVYLVDPADIDFQGKYSSHAPQKVFRMYPGDEIP